MTDKRAAISGHPSGVELALRNRQVVSSGADLAPWRTWLRSKYATTTVSTYEVSVRYLMDWLRSRGLSPLDVTEDEALAWRRDMLDAGLSPRTVNIRLSGAGSLYRYAGIPDPLAPAKLRVGNQRKRDAFTDEEVRCLLNSCDDTVIGSRDRAGIALMAYCGLRMIELSRTQLSDLRRANGRRVLHVTGKGRLEADEFVVLPAVAEAALMAWLAVRPGDPDGPLFTSTSRQNVGSHLPSQHFGNMVRAKMRACGVGNGDRRLTPHSLRHTFVTKAIQGGATPLQVKAAARHSSVDTTLAYYHMADRLDDPAEDRVDYGGQVLGASDEQE